jgi:polyphosphate kinase
MCAALGKPAYAHPHVFVDTQLEISFNTTGQADGVRITWIYDDLTSLQFITDRGMDEDFDGKLTVSEQAALSGFDMDWDEGYPGDTYALSDVAVFQLSGPSDWTAVYENGKVTTTHFRRLLPPVTVGTDPLVIKVYDPSLYSRYYIVGEPKVTGRADCKGAIQRPDLIAANEKLAAAIAALPGDAENEFPALGAIFAEEVRITCAVQS